MGHDRAHLAQAQAVAQQGQPRAHALAPWNSLSLCVSLGSNVKHHPFPA